MEGGTLVMSQKERSCLVVMFPGEREGNGHAGSSGDSGGKRGGDNGSSAAGAVGVG